MAGLQAPLPLRGRAAALRQSPAALVKFCQGARDGRAVRSYVPVSVPRLALRVRVDTPMTGQDFDIGFYMFLSVGRLCPGWGPQSSVSRMLKFDVEALTTLSVVGSLVPRWLVVARWLQKKVAGSTCITQWQTGAWMGRGG